MKKFIQSINRLHNNYKANVDPNLPLSWSFYLCRVFVWFTVILTIFESLAVIFTRIMEDYDIFNPKYIYFSDILNLRIMTRYFANPIAILFRSFCAIIFTIE